MKQKDGVVQLIVSFYVCHDPNSGVMTSAREPELLYPEPVASFKNKTTDATHS